MSFCITGIGRCGTMALARILDMDPEWTVRHQTDSLELRNGYMERRFWKRFDKEKYGEVNGALLPGLSALPCHKAVIIRNLEDMAVSAANYSVHHGNPTVPLIDELPWTVPMLKRLLAVEEVRMVRYEDLFTDDGLRSLCLKIGMPICAAPDLETRHNGVPRVFDKLEDLEPRHQEIVNSFGWFQEKLGYA